MTILLLCVCVQVWASKHLATPFGAVSSVHSWERVGMMLATLARRLLHLPVLRYVDDFFTAEREESAAHAMMCFARFVRMLLGETTIEAKKLDYGPKWRF